MKALLCTSVVFAVVAAPASAVQAVLITPVAHYSFDSGDVSGATIFDVSPSGNDATSFVAASSGAAPLVGSNTATAPTLVSGVFGDAISFNGTTQYAAADGDALGLSSAFTIAEWFNPLSAGDSTAVTSTNGQWEFDIIGGQEQGYVRTNGNWYSSNGTTPLADTWVHLALTWSSTAQQVQLFINGVAQTAVGTTSTLEFVAADHNLYIGTYRGGTAYYTQGLIDELFVFDTVLTPEEINNLIEFNATAPPQVPEPASLALVSLGIVGLARKRRRSLRTA